MRVQGFAVYIFTHRRAYMINFTQTEKNLAKQIKLIKADHHDGKEILFFQKIGFLTGYFRPPVLARRFVCRSRFATNYLKYHNFFDTQTPINNSPRISLTPNLPYPYSV